MATAARFEGLFGAVRPRTVRLQAEIFIEAPAERVWSVLTDFAAFPQWNPFIREVEGEPREGARLRVRLQTGTSRPWVLRPTLLRFEPQRELRWLGQVFFTGLFDGEHRFVLDAFSSGTRFVQAETFRGLLVPLLAPALEDDTRRGFHEMNRALKGRAEHAPSRG